MKDLRDKIVTKKVSDLKPHKGSHNIERALEVLQQSIEKFGLVQPIIIDKNNVVVAGNGVLESAKRLGLAEVPCIVLDDLSDEEIKQYRIADNKTSEFSSWNREKLKKEMTYLEDVNDLQFCFDENLNRMCGFVPEPSKPTTSAPAAPVPPAVDENGVVDIPSPSASSSEAPSSQADVPDASSPEIQDPVKLQRELERQQKEEKKFEERIKATEKSMEAQSTEYYEFHCSKCGKTIRVRK